MNTSASLEEVLAVALKLAPRERLQLIEQIASSVEQDITDVQPRTEHWGQSLNRLIDELEPIDLLYPEIEDPVEWVKHLRAEQRKKRLGDEE